VGDTEKENNQKKTAHPGKKLPERLALKLSFSYPPPKNVLRSSGLASHYSGSPVNDWGRLLTNAQISLGERLSRSSISPQDLVKRIKRKRN
jgi:hypothetical protein